MSRRAEDEANAVEVGAGEEVSEMTDSNESRLACRGRLKEGADRRESGAMGSLILREAIMRLLFESPASLVVPPPSMRGLASASSVSLFRLS